MSLAALRALLRPRSLPDGLVVFVTSRCNSRCPSCFLGKKLDSPDDLTPDDIAALARSTGPLTWLDLTGGEPFLRDDLPRIAALFHEHSRPAFLSIPTNGSLPEALRRQVPEILRSCPGAAVTVPVSIDGLGADHDRLRMEPGAWEKALASLEVLRSLRGGSPALRVAVCTIVSQATAAGIPALLDFVRRELDVDLHALNVLRGEPRDPSALPPSAEAWEEASRAWLSHLGHYYGRLYRFPGAAALALRLQGRLARRYAACLRGLPPDSACVAPRRSAVEYPDGTVSVCELKEPLGRLKDHGGSLARLWLDPKAAARRESLARAPCACTHASFQSRNAQLRFGFILRALLGMD